MVVVHFRRIAPQRASLGVWRLRQRLGRGSEYEYELALLRHAITVRH